MPQEELMLWRFLRILPQLVGKANAKTSKEIMELMGLRPTKSDTYVRKLAKILLNVKDIALCSGRAGFYVASGRDELIEFRENLLKRQLALRKDVRSLDRILRENPRYGARKAMSQIREVIMAEIKEPVSNGSS